MLVHFLELGCLPDYSDFDYENCKVLAAQKVKQFDKFIKFIKAMKNHDVIINDKWYTIESYALSFPADNEHIPCLKIFVYDI